MLDKSKEGPKEVLKRIEKAMDSDAGVEVHPDGSEIRRPVFSTASQINSAASKVSQRRGVRANGIGLARSSSGTVPPSNVTPDHLRSKPLTGKVSDAPQLHRPAFEFHDRPSPEVEAHRAQIFKPRGSVTPEDFKQ